jgi:hypothetical protein
VKSNGDFGISGEDRSNGTREKFATSAKAGEGDTALPSRRWIISHSRERQKKTFERKLTCIQCLMSRSQIDVGGMTGDLAAVFDSLFDRLAEVKPDQHMNRCAT